MKNIRTIFFYRHYPHEWWCAGLSKMGNSLQEPVQLIVEGKEALYKEIETYEKLGLAKRDDVFDKESKVPSYASYESRFQQFYGQVEFLKIFFKNDLIGIGKGMEIIIHKLSYLLDFVRERGYKKQEYLNVIDQFASLTIEVVDQFAFEDEQKLKLLNVIKHECENLYANQLEYREKESENDED